VTRPPVRQLLGWVLAVAGAVALFLGWYGVSGTAVTAKQIPYVVSGGLTGVSLLVLAAACFASDDVRRRLDRLDDVQRQVDTLYRLLTGPGEEDEPGDAEILALSGGTSYHRPSCRLVHGKPDAAVIAVADAADRGLTACRVCDPPELRVA
jgi:hypothetical protein